MNEQEVIAQLEEAEREWNQAKRSFAEKKRQLVEAETNVVNCKIAYDRAKEVWRIHKATTPKYEANKRDESIEQFRKDHSDVVEFAKQRDLHRDDPCCCGHPMHEGRICGARKEVDNGRYIVGCLCSEHIPTCCCGHMMHEGRMCGACPHGKESPMLCGVCREVGGISVGCRCDGHDPSEEFV